jgi:hypothetical protein
LVFFLLVVALVAFLLYRSYVKFAREHAVREARKEVIERLFGDEFGEFFLELEVPLKDGVRVSPEDAKACGRHIMLYLVHNPDEANRFIEAMHGATPLEAASYESMAETIEGVRLVGFRAISHICASYQHSFFSGVDVDRVRNYVRSAEAPGRGFFLWDGLNNTSLQGTMPKRFTIEYAPDGTEIRTPV